MAEINLETLNLRQLERLAAKRLKARDKAVRIYRSYNVNPRSEPSLNKGTQLAKIALGLTEDHATVLKEIERRLALEA